jgi:glycosyltransferase involved in cell wall biosynthesis
MMRIAFYSPQTSHLKPGLERGGDPIFLHDLFAELRRRGHEIEVISNLNVRQLWRGDVPARSLFAEAIAVRRKVKEFRPDAWLVYNPSRGHPDLFGWWQRPRRYVLLGASTHQSRRMRQPWCFFLAWSHRRSLRRADWVTAARPKTAERLHRHGVPTERLSVLPPAVAARERVPTQREARGLLDFPLDEPLVLCVSRFTPLGSTQQKTEIVLQLLASVASLREKPLVVIVGDGPGRAEIEERASQIRPEGRVLLFPAVPNEDLVWFYAACDFYAYPDLIDLPRLSVLEAQACGRPVLTMRTASSELIVSDGCTGVLVRDLVEFRSRLGELVADRARREAMGRAAREYVVTQHSMEVRARQLEGFLESR